MHMPVIRAAWNEEIGNYDFASQLKDVKYFLNEPDLTVVNLETRLAGEQNSGYSGYPLFNYPEQLAFCFKKTGVDIVALTNNHSLDRGFEGIVKTIEYIKQADLYYVGNYVSAEDRENLLVVDVNGVKIGILNYTEHTNGIPVPKGKEFCVNIIYRF